MWFQMYDFEVEWVPGNSNVLADSLTREMNKVHVHRNDIFRLPGKTPADDSFETFVQRFRLLDFIIGDVVQEKDCWFKIEKKPMDPKVPSRAT